LTLPAALERFALIFGPLYPKNVAENSLSNLPVLQNKGGINGLGDAFARLTIRFMDRNLVGFRPTKPNGQW
jgi:hypothetical protein